MKVHELIIALQSMPEDAEVWHLWDGAARTTINVVWVACDGKVITSDYGMCVNDTHTRPVGAPTRAEELYWRTQNEE